MSRIPIITAVIPTYRRSAVLARAISSVVAQTFRDIRIAVFDNASDDDTRTVVERFAMTDSRIEYYRHDTNVGAENNFAFAVSRVTTPFFSILCDDDVLLPGYYELALKAFEPRPEAGFFGGSTLVVTEAGRLLVAPSAAWSEVEEVPSSDLVRIAGGGHPSLPGVLFRTRAVEEAGGIDTAAGSLIDVDLYLSVARRYPFMLSREPCGFLTVHERSWSSNPGRVEREYAHVLEKLRGDAGHATPGSGAAAAVAAARDLRLLELAITSNGRAGETSARNYPEILAELGNARFARAARAIRAAAPVPGFIKFVRAFLALRLQLACRRNLRRLARLGERRAASGYDAELRYFKELTAAARALPPLP